MNVLRWLREQAKGYDCNVCGQNHSKSDIRVLGRLESAWIVRVTCARCQTSFKLLVVVDESHPAVAEAKPVATPAARRTRDRRAPVSADEVLDAHEFLRAYDGDLKALFRRQRAGAATAPEAE
ncbi:MAG TPA: hypothetical protein VFA01_03200 [Candidatus Dormibacteraeota bacterium]|jgi:hypothetical protein|nr:hypothetical protein [Candidatus Dormibacteraeota bacterium]